MFKKYINKAIAYGSVALLIAGIVSCEKDFTDIGTSIINNNEFNTKDTILEIIVNENPITSIRTDNIEQVLGQYLLGVYNNANYEKIEASIISQLAIGADLKVVDRVYGTDTTVVTQIDAAYLKLPYQATLKTDGSGEYELDSIIGDTETPFTLNVYELTTFLNTLDPANPENFNSLHSDDVFQINPAELNTDVNYQFKPNPADTMAIVGRKLSTGEIYITDTIKLTGSLPFARIPLKNDMIKQLFLDKYETGDFASQEAFNNYFRGIMLKTEGSGGSLISFNFNNIISDQNPSIEVFYTNTVLASGSIIDTIKKNDSYSLAGIRTSTYNMTPNNPSPLGSFQIQGTAGTHANIELFGANATDIRDKIAELRAKNWLINDASLIMHVNQNVVGFDTIATPFRLFLYKNGEAANLNSTQINDIFSFPVGESEDIFGGRLELSDDRKPNKYVFRITRYISDLLSGETDYAPTLTLKVINPTDIPLTFNDTIVDTYNWNPKAVMLLDHSVINGDKRIQLKISYSEKITN